MRRQGGSAACPVPVPKTKNCRRRGGNRGHKKPRTGRGSGSSSAAGQIRSGPVPQHFGHFRRSCSGMRRAWLFPSIGAPHRVSEALGSARCHCPSAFTQSNNWQSCSAPLTTRPPRDRSRAAVPRYATGRGSLDPEGGRMPRSPSRFHRWG